MLQPDVRQIYLRVYRSSWHCGTQVSSFYYDHWCSTCLHRFLGKNIPGGFVPEEDEGYYLVNIQLPDASSLERTDQVARKIEKIINDTEGVAYSTMVVGL
jgi:Cu/Ag efflux pump CusA